MAERIVVISGGGTGIGRSLAEHFAAAGDRIVVIGRRAEPLREVAAELGGVHVDPVAADLSDPAAVDRVAERIAIDHGRVDVLVNAAGGNALTRADPSSLAGSPGVAWHWTENFRLNVLTAVLLTEALTPLLTRPGARVVLVSSIAAYRGSGSGSYAAAKAALHPYVYDKARALGEDGITVNAVAPGYIADTEFFGAGMNPQRRRALVDQTMDKRAGAPDDIAAAVSWLTSPAAGHITAQILQVNGGAELGR